MVLFNRIISNLKLCKILLKVIYRNFFKNYRTYYIFEGRLTYSKSHFFRVFQTFYKKRKIFFRENYHWNGLGIDTFTRKYHLWQFFTITFPLPLHFQKNKRKANFALFLQNWEVKNIVLIRFLNRYIIE